MNSRAAGRSPSLPPGWPRQVRPPGTPGWELSATAWLLDLCPAEYRSYPVVQRHPLALAWLAGRHVESQADGCRRGLAAVRSELGATLGPVALEQVLDMLELEAARLVAAARGVGHVTRALSGEQYIPRL